jgi:hypothetical protein
LHFLACCLVLFCYVFPRLGRRHRNSPPLPSLFALSQTRSFSFHLFIRCVQTYTRGSMRSNNASCRRRLNAKQTCFVIWNPVEEKLDNIQWVKRSPNK